MEKAITSGTNGNLCSQSESSSSGTSTTTYSDDNIVEMAEDLSIDTRCLTGNDSLLKQSLLDLHSERAVHEPISLDWDPSKLYADQIRNRFPQANDDLVMLLGKNNYERYLRCQAMKEKAENEDGTLVSRVQVS